VLTCASAAVLIFWTVAPSPHTCVFAQQTSELKVSVGAVTKYSGSYSSSERQRCQDFLDILETQLAAEFVKLPELDYVDRSSLDEVFHELHLSSDIAFDTSSGALRGLLSRLDLLIVAVASSPSSARVRVLDVETGAVKGVAICQPRTSIFGGLSATAPECIATIISQTSSAAKARLTLKRQRLMKAAAAERAAEEQRTMLAQKEKEEERAAEEQRIKLAQKEKEEERERAQQALIAAQEQAKEEAAAQQRQAEIEQQISAARPKYEDAITRLSGETAFWNQIAEELRRQGGSLRPEIRSALESAHMTADRCGESFKVGKPDVLNTCIGELNRKLDQMEKYK
jgi:flagellar biosynthesis GTPase FlhF